MKAVPPANCTRSSMINYENGMLYCVIISTSMRKICWDGVEMEEDMKSSDLSQEDAQVQNKC